MPAPSRPHSTPLPTAVRWVQALVGPRLQPGDVVVDATAGNGHDTLFLAQRVLPGGQVIAFDIQPEAIRQTRLRLESAAIDLSTVTLFAAGHEHLDHLLPKTARHRLRLCMFNLGYLPGGDKARITQVETTLSALKQALTHLADDGVLTVVVYPGHEGGDREAVAVESMLASLPADTWEAQRMGFLNFRPTTPYAMVVRKRTPQAPDTAPETAN